MRKIKKKFHAFIKKNKEEHLLFIIDFLFVATLFSIFAFGGNEYYLISWLFFIAFSALLFLVLFILKGIKINNIVLISFLFLISMLISWSLNGFQSFNRRNVLLILFFNVFLQYFILIKNFEKTIKLIYYSILSFAIFYIIFYFKDIITSSIKGRVGDEIANVNTIGFIFTIGFVISFYFLFFQKMYYETIFVIVFASLAMLTGSKKVVLSIVTTGIVGMLIFFGKKKSHFSVLTIFLFIIFFIILLNVPQFNTMKIRFLNFLNTFFGKNNEDSSTISRLFMIKESIILFLRRPLFGWGFNGYARVGISSIYSHNNFTELLSNFGIMGFLLFEVLLILPIIHSLKLLNYEKKENVFIILLGVVLFISQFSMVTIDSKDFYIYIAFFNSYYLFTKAESELTITYNKFVNTLYRISKGDKNVS